MKIFYKNNVIASGKHWRNPAFVNSFEWIELQHDKKKSTLFPLVTFKPFVSFPLQSSTTGDFRSEKRSVTLCVSLPLSLIIPESSERHKEG